MQCCRSSLQALIASCCVAAQVENAAIGLPSVEPETLAAAVRGHHDWPVDRVVLVDCRYEYEHAGGCVAGAVNMQVCIVPPLISWRCSQSFCVADAVKMQVCAVSCCVRAASRGICIALRSVSMLTSEASDTVEPLLYCLVPAFAVLSLQDLTDAGPQQGNGHRDLSAGCAFSSKHALAATLARSWYYVLTLFRLLQDPTEMEAATIGASGAVDWSRTVVVFYCEFSSERGPRMFRHIRNLDRRLHLASYPALAVPHMYVLAGGYKAFQVGTRLPSQAPVLCWAVTRNRDPGETRKAALMLLHLDPV